MPDTAHPDTGHPDTGRPAAEPVLTPDLIARMTARRGTAHPFARLDPVRTALVVIDMQNGFLLPEAGYVAIPAALEIIPAINRAANALRTAGGRVVWIVTSHLPQTPEDWSVNCGALMRDGGAARAAALAPGSFGHALHDGLAVDPADDIVEKTRFSCFLPGTCALPERLRANGIDSVAIAGTATNVCCESSARDAMMLNFRTVMLSDANAAMSEAEHRAALTGFYSHFGDVLTVAEFQAALAASA